MGFMAAAMPYISMGASAAGAMLSARGASESAKATADAMNYQAQVARNNQAIAEGYARSELQRGEVMAQQKQQETAQRVGSARAAAGGAGLDVDSGTPLRLQADTLAMGDLDVRTIRYNAGRAAYGYRVQGASYAAQAGLDEMTAENALRAGKLEALGAIISGAASVSGKWANFQKTGT